MQAREYLRPLPLELGIENRKRRGAYFTPPTIAEFLSRWAIANRADARVMDPTCGDGAFLKAAAQELQKLGSQDLAEQLTGIDIYEPSLQEAAASLRAQGASANLVNKDAFELEPPGAFFPTLPPFDAVVGNPPFVRYQNHRGEARKASLTAALRQGVRLSGLASSWASLLIHASSFLTPDGRLAMVLPAELLTVGYAEPVRKWLRRRFSSVKLIIFEKLQFEDALANVVLLLAQGTGGCDAFSLYFVDDAEDLEKIQPFDEMAVTMSTDSKWTDLLLTVSQRQLFKSVVGSFYQSLGDLGSPELGTVTGSNDYFALSESTRRNFELDEQLHVLPISPPGTRHLKGLAFTRGDWQGLRDAGERVWMLHPNSAAEFTPGLRRYIESGEEAGVNLAYKCQIRTPWWRPPAVSAPDFFFTYMSHRFPRIVANHANVSFVNSMHGIRLRPDVPKTTRESLSLLALNSVTLLGAEVFGRSYGGGILKMEPREAAILPIPTSEVLERAWTTLRPERDALNRQLRNGVWTTVVARVDEVLLRECLSLTADEVSVLRAAVHSLRTRRLSRGSISNDD